MHFTVRFIYEISLTSLTVRNSFDFWKKLFINIVGFQWTYVEIFINLGTIIKILLKTKGMLFNKEILNRLYFIIVLILLLVFIQLIRKGFKQIYLVVFHFQFFNIIRVKLLTLTFIFNIILLEFKSIIRFQFFSQILFFV